MALSPAFEQDSPRRHLLRFAFRWVKPDWAVVSTLSEASWRSQHEEISKTIWNLTSLLVAASLFCLFVLGAPDSSLVSTDAKITIPIVSITASYADFLLFGPIFLIGLALYLHVFLERRLDMGRPIPSEATGGTEPLSPYIFNLGIPWADRLSMCLFYWMLPAVLGFFVWKAIPRPEAAWLLFLAFVVMSGLMAALKIHRFAVEPRGSALLPSRLRLGGYWVVLAVCACGCIPLVWIAGSTFIEQIQRTRKTGARSSDASGLLDFPLLRLHRLQLFGADLDKKNLTGFYAPYADLRKADLRDTDLEGANLLHADLTKADLTGANLTGANLGDADLNGADLSGVKFDKADLRNVRFDKDTTLDIKWRRVICVVNGDLSKDCLKRQDLTWTDLAGADLGQSNLRGQQMTGADLSYTDLSKADLTGAILRGTDLRNALLPPSIKDAIVDGALTTGQPGLPASGKDTFVSLENRATGACLEAPLLSANASHPTMAWPCADPGDRMGSWKVRRLANGFFVFASPRAGAPACLDGTTFNDGAQAQMWECNDDYENQYWRLTPLTGGLVRMDKNDTGFCLNGLGSREGSPIPLLTKCDSDDHSQHWNIAFPKVPAAEQATRRGDELRQQRERDLRRAIRQYVNSPDGPMYGSTSLRPEGGSERPRPSPYRGRPSPNRPSPFRPGPPR